MVEVEPIKCWWRTSASAVRTGESFDVRLTCAVVETEAAKVVPDLSKLDPTVVQLPPFEVQGGSHPGDLLTPGRRFIQYDYRMRLIAEDAFGADVAIPPLEVTYTVESKVAGGDTVKGREQSYALPRASVKLISVVPDDTSDIREAPAASFEVIEARDSRADLFQTIAAVLFALAGVHGRGRSRWSARSKTKTAARSRTFEAARDSGARRERAQRRAAGQPRRMDAGTGRPRALGRAHRRQLRVHRTRSVSGRPPGEPAAGRRCSSAAPLGPPRGRVRLGLGHRGKRSASAGGTSRRSSRGAGRRPQDHERARYGRDGKRAADDALNTAIRVTKEQQSAHSLISERAIGIARRSACESGPGRRDGDGSWLKRRLTPLVRLPRRPEQTASRCRQFSGIRPLSTGPRGREWGDLRLERLHLLRQGRPRHGRSWSVLIGLAARFWCCGHSARAQPAERRMALPAIVGVRHGSGLARLAVAARRPDPGAGRPAVLHPGAGRSSHLAHACGDHLSRPPHQPADRRLVEHAVGAAVADGWPKGAPNNAAFFTTVGAAAISSRRRMPGKYRDLMALIEFGDDAYVITPFTTDYENILLSTSLIGDWNEFMAFPDQGTVVARAVEQGVACSARSSTSTPRAT